MPRNLISQTVKKFRGINLVTVSSNLGPEWAQWCVNVIPSPSGGLEKLRVPTTKSPLVAQLIGLGDIFNFQNALGTRQVISAFGDLIYSFTLDAYTAAQIDSTTLNQGMYSATQSNNIMFMANGTRMMKWTGTTLWKWGIPKAGMQTASQMLYNKNETWNPSRYLGTWDTPYNDPAQNTSGHLSFTYGRRYRVSYGNSTTGHIGAASEPSERIGAGLTDTAIAVLMPNPNALYDDYGIDVMWLYGTIDGGEDYFLIPNPATADGSFPVTGTSGGTTLFIDNTLDDPDPDHDDWPYLNKAIIAPLINFQPPVGKYVCKFQGRIFVAKLDGSPQEIAYSGYERIFSGRPEESFPPNNRLRLAIGADEIRGIGSLQGGVVAFSKSNEMYMLRGSVEDITVDSPVQFTAMLEQLPYSEGCASHYSIAETPYGLCWLGADMCPKIWNGSGPPRPLAPALTPFFRHITADAGQYARGVFYNWLEKEWYVLALPWDHPTPLRQVLVIDLDPSEEDNIGAILFDIGPFDAMTVVEDSAGTRQLLISQGGYLKQLNVSSSAINGLSETGSSK